MQEAGASAQPVLSAAPFKVCSPLMTEAAEGPAGLRIKALTRLHLLRRSPLCSRFRNHESAVDGSGHLPLRGGLLRPAPLHPLHLPQEVWRLAGVSLET